MGDAFESLSILVPCYNEAHRLGGTVAKIAGFLRGIEISTELLLVDDGSTDGTSGVIETSRREHDFVRAVRLPSNRGKGAALAEGVRAAEGDAVVFFDADLSYPLDTIHEAVERLETGADVVIGGRDLDPDSAKRTYDSSRRIASFAFNRLVDHYLGLGIPDTQCGFKAFRGPIARALFGHLTVERFGFDVELLFLVKRWGLRLERIPVRMTHQTGSSVRLVRDGLRMWSEIRQIRRNARTGVYPEELPKGS